MRKFINIGILIWVLFITMSGCSTQWTDVIQYGAVSSSEFKETVKLETQLGLIFANVTIQGKEYRYLFDSGAPFSISTQLQQHYNFKKVSNGNIVDSDQNRKKVIWVQVDSIAIGDIAFTDLSAFVGDFKASPILKCLDIDGIIGSNLMRHCNWTIDQEQNLLSFSDTIDVNDLEESIGIPFITDNQYKIFIRMNFGQTKIKNILMDYGSNGSISLNRKLFDTLKERNVIGDTYLEKGFKQTGIVGKAVTFSREVAWSDSVSINNIDLENVLLKTGGKVSVGNDLLSKFKVTIDWGNSKLYLKDTGKKSFPKRSFGFKLGYSSEQGVYIQSVILNSIAYKKGIRPNMQVLRFDTLDFEKDNDFCDYVNTERGDKVFLQLIDSMGQKLEYHIKKSIVNNENNL